MGWTLGLEGRPVEGNLVGKIVGLAVGIVGLEVGFTVGIVGLEVGFIVGLVGLAVGGCDRRIEGDAVGDLEGLRLGAGEVDLQQ